MTTGHSPLHDTPSGVAGVVWPNFAAGETAALAALMHRLERTQWLSADALALGQCRQLVRTAEHAQNHSAHFRRRMQDARLRPQDFSVPDGLRQLPVMGRRALQEAGELLFCAQLPKTHAPVSDARTSGSSGEPVLVKRTAVNGLMWSAMTLREHLWQKRDFSGRSAVIRANLQGGRKDWPDWGPPVSLLFETGTFHGLPITTDLSRQFDWLLSIDPDYLLVYPTNLAALLDRFASSGRKLTCLRQIRTIGETLRPGIREAARTVLGVEVADTYSSQEAGVIALQCPASGFYHTMAESLIVEVLNDQGEPCAAGEIGRVVITDLQNFATPLIRYDIGDYAEAANSCPCGRGLPVLKRIMGRERNMVRLPDGRRFWPLVGFVHFREVAPIRQYQLIQREAETIEVRLVSDTPLQAGQERRLGEFINKSLGYPFELQFTYYAEQIPRSRGGKFEEFVCELR